MKKKCMLFLDTGEIIMDHRKNIFKKMRKSEHLYNSCAWTSLKKPIKIVLPLLEVGCRIIVTDDIFLLTMF